MAVLRWIKILSTIKQGILIEFLVNLFIWTVYYITSKSEVKEYALNSFLFGIPFVVQIFSHMNCEKKESLKNGCCILIATYYIFLVFSALLGIMGFHAKIAFWLGPIPISMTKEIMTCLYVPMIATPFMAAFE